MAMGVQMGKGHEQPEERARLRGPLALREAAGMGARAWRPVG
jgi:hypothetical protein